MAFYGVWHTGLLYKFTVIRCYEKVFYVIEPFPSGKRLWVALKHESSFKCVINAGIPQSFLSNILCLEWAKES